MLLALEIGTDLASPDDFAHPLRETGRLVQQVLEFVAAQLPYLDILGGDGRLHLCSVWRDRNLIGIAPLKVLGSTARFIASPEVCDYQDFAVRPGSGPAFWGALRSHLAGQGIEALELAYPLRVASYRVRRGSGGRGAHPGGDGIARSLVFLAPARLTLVCERREHAPWGLAGGGPGARGESWLVSQARRTRLPAKGTVDVAAGDRLEVLTPGGGGWGDPAAEEA